MFAQARLSLHHSTKISRALSNVDLCAANASSEFYDETAHLPEPQPLNNATAKALASLHIGTVNRLRFWLPCGFCTEKIYEINKLVGSFLKGVRLL